MKPPVKNDRSPWLWVWVGGAFAVMLAAWGVFIVVAAGHHVADVPVVTRAPH